MKHQNKNNKSIQNQQTVLTTIKMSTLQSKKK